MARAVLRIDVDTSSVSRAMGDIRSTARSAQAAMTADARAQSQQRDRLARDEARHRQRMELEAVRTSRTALRMQTDAARSAANERARASTLAARTEIAAQGNATRLYIAAERNRTLVHIAEERRRTQVTDRETRAREAAERRSAREAARVAQARTRAGRDIGIGLRRGLNVGNDAALNVGRVAYAQIRDERRTRAEANRTLTYALGGAGIRGFSTQARQQVSAFSELTGMSYEDVVNALSVGQQRGSALELNGRTPERALNDALDTIRNANATNTNAGQLLAARGRLGGAGISGANLDEVMRYVQFAADRGSVEVDQIIQQGLPGALRLMSSRTAGVSPEQRQQAAVAAFRESVAVQEVMAGAGGRAGQVSNAYNAFQTALSTPRRQDLMRANLRNYARSLTGRDDATRARRAAVMGLIEGPNALYEDDPARRGARRLRADVANSPLALMDRVTQAMGGDSGAAANIFAGGGHGNAQGLLSNVRLLFATLGAINPETGRARTESVRALSGGGYTPAEMEARRKEVENDDLAQIRKNEETRARSLTDNTSAIVRLANSIDNFATQNPLGSAALQSGVGLLGGVLGGALFPRIGASLAGTQVGAAIAGTQAAQVAASGGAVGGVGLAGGAVAGGLAAMGGAARTAITGNTVGGGRTDTIGRINAGLAALSPTGAVVEMGAQTIGALARAIQGMVVQATVPAHEAAHAASARPAGGR
jgi:hypothetical protein